MKANVASASVLLISGLLAVFAAFQAAHGQPRDSATVRVTITVAPIADITFPQGSDFLIHVPHNASPRGATIQPVRIPFTVHGNATASLFAAPAAFLRISDDTYRGEALGPDGGSERIGYDIIVQFPVPSQDYHGLPGRGGFGAPPAHHGMASLPFTEGDPTAPPMSADMAERNFVAHGTIHIVARHHWTESGDFAAAGDYRGAIEVTVVADNQ